MDAKKYIDTIPAVKDVAEKKETVWVNPRFLPFEVTDGVCQLVVSDEDIADAEARLARFAPFIMRCFPETRETNGLIESQDAKGPSGDLRGFHPGTPDAEDGQPPGHRRLHQGPRRYL